MSIEGYTMFRHDRTRASGKSHGGILVYCTEERDVNQIENGAFCTPNVESLWLQMNFPNSRPTIICSVYRPPDSNLNDSSNDLQTQIDLLEISHRSDIIILGDLNVELLSPSVNKTELTTFVRNLKLEQLCRATRVTTTTSTLLDHIWCNNSLLYAHRGLLDTGLSDHTLVFCCRKQKKLLREKKVIEIRS